MSVPVNILARELLAAGLGDDLKPAHLDPFAELLVHAEQSAKKIRHRPTSTRNAEVVMAAAVLVLLAERAGYVAMLEHEREMGRRDRGYVDMLRDEAPAEVVRRVDEYWSQRVAEHKAVR